MNEQYIDLFKFIAKLHEQGVERTETIENLMKYAIFEDVAPVVHAHRVHCHSAGGGTHWLACSEFQSPIDHADKYCRNCGARMEGKE